MRVSNLARPEISESELKIFLDLQIIDDEYSIISRRIGTNGERGLAPQRRKLLTKLIKETKAVKKMLLKKDMVLVIGIGNGHLGIVVTKDEYVDAYGEENYNIYLSKI